MGRVPNASRFPATMKLLRELWEEFINERGPTEEDAMKWKDILPVAKKCLENSTPSAARQLEDAAERLTNVQALKLKACVTKALPDATFPSDLDKLLREFLERKGLKVADDEVLEARIGNCRDVVLGAVPTRKLRKR